MKLRWQTSYLWLPVILAVAVPSAARAQDTATVDRVKAKIQGARYAQQTLDIIHLGCKSNGATVQNVTAVSGQDGQILPGQFACKVRYHWTDLGGSKGWSDMTYFFDSRGRYYAFRTGDTTARFLKHFAEAKLAVAALRDLILPAIENPQRREEIRDLVNKARIEDVFQLKMVLDFP